MTISRFRLHIRTNVRFFAATFAVLLSLYAAAEAQKTPAAEPAIQKCWEHKIGGAPDDRIATDNAAVIIVRDRSFVEAVGLDAGKLLWSTDVGGQVNSNLLAANENVYFVRGSGTDGGDTSNLVAMSAATGVTRWTRPLNEPGYFTLGMIGGRVAAISVGGRVTIVSAGDGLPAWAGQLEGPLTAGPQIGPANITYVAGSNKVISLSSPAFDMPTVAISPFAVRLAARFEDDLIVWGDERGLVTSYSASSEKVEWSFKSGAAISSLAVVDGAVIVGSNDNFVYALGRGRGDRIWKKRVSGRIQSLKLVDEDTLLLQTIGETNVRLLSVKNGKTIGQLSTSDQMPIAVAVTPGGRVVVVGELSLFAYGLSGCPKN